MSRWVFDLESDGLLDTITKIHCIVLRHMETGEVKSFGPDEINDALYLLTKADEVCGHNVIAYDIPALQKIYPDFTVSGKVTDTLVMSRLIRTTLAEDDSVMIVKSPAHFPRKLIGSHGLKAWGLRLSAMLGDDHRKGDYDGGWENYSQAMMDYCILDTEVTKTLYDHLFTFGFSQESLDLEHSMAEVCLRIGNNGWTFDKKKAIALYSELCQVREELQTELDDLFPPWEVTEEFIPKSNNKTRGYVKGEVFIKRNLVEFNPGSRRHIEKCLRDKYKWKPKKFTATGHAMIDETILSGLPYPEAQQLAKFFLVQKRIGQLAEGPAAWLKKVDDDGKIRHTIVVGGTVSGRCAHRGPNLAQVPKGNLLYGRQCRELFKAPEGWLVAGVDLSGLELRMLANFLDDGGEYARQINDGDIHQFNADAIGTSRDIAKTFIYATCFGAGDALVGKIAGGGPKEGKALKAAFNKSIPAFAKLQSNLKRAAQRGYLVGLCGRKLYVREERKLLSQLLQGSGAVICKKWVQLTDAEITKHYGPDEAYVMAWVHDEQQIACKTKEIAEHVREIAIRMANQTGRHFKTKIAIDAAGCLAESWADSH